MDTDVLIIGYGPVGVSAANFLGTLGVQTLVVERDPGIYQRARAVTVNDWTLRAFQSVGLDDRLKADMDENGALTWKSYNRRTVFRLNPQGSGFGHPASMMIYQPAMEKSLREGVGRFPDTVRVRFGETLTAVQQDCDGVTATVRRDDGSAGRVRARYLLACDGGSSQVRAAVGVPLEGSTHETTWIVIDAEMLRWWPDCKELVFWSDPVRPVVDIPLALGNHRWELPLHEGERPSDFDSEDALWNLLRPLGVTRENVRIKQHAFYVHHVRHAQRWRVGRVLLAGDAAHLMPPWAGQGMQSGVRDAQNVCWKLAAVLDGRLDESVLDTYEAERAPHVAQVTVLSQKLGKLIAGADPTFVRLRNNLGPVIMRVPALTRRMMPGTAPQLDEGWLTGRPGKRSSVGLMLPQPMVSTCRGAALRLDDLLGCGFAALALDVNPRELMTPTQIADWTALGCRFLTIRGPRDTARSDDDVIDHTGTLRSWLHRHRAKVVAVRPDRFVAASDRDGLDAPSRVHAPVTAPDEISIPIS